MCAFLGGEARSIFQYGFYRFDISETVIILVYWFPCIIPELCTHCKSDIFPLNMIAGKTLIEFNNGNQFPYTVINRLLFKGLITRAYLDLYSHTELRKLCTAVCHRCKLVIVQNHCDTGFFLVCNSGLLYSTFSNFVKAHYQNRL